MLALRSFSSEARMAAFHEPFRNWPSSANPLDWSFEGTIEAIYRACLRPGDAAIDGGANQGRHTGPMAEAVQEHGLVVAGDANSAMTDYLREKFADTPAVRPLFAALGSGVEDVEFSVAVADHGRSSLHISPGVTQIERIRVPQRRIDDIDTGGRRVRFIKLDLEGGEYGALRGAEERLRIDRPVLCLEHIRQFMPYFGVGYGEFFALFDRTEYVLLDILGSAFEPKVACWSGWKPSYLVALPKNDAELAQLASSALREYTSRIYRDIPTWTVVISAYGDGATTRLIPDNLPEVLEAQSIARPPGPSQIGPNEMRLLTWLGEKVCSGAGVCVDAGCGSGGSTHAICVGLSRNAGLARKEGRLHCFDRFIYDHPSYKSFLVPGVDEPVVGDTFIQHFFANIGAFHPFCLVHAGNLSHQIWDDTPVELLFVDVAKTWPLMRRVVEMFFGCLIPGRSIIVHQDFERPNLHWIHTSIAYLLEECPIASPPVDCSLVLEVRRTIPEEKLARLIADDFTLAERLALLDKLVSAVSEHSPGEQFDAVENARVTRAYLHAHHGDRATALKIAAECRERPYFTARTAYNWMLNSVAAAPAKA